PAAGDVQSAAGALPAAHGQHHGFGVQLEQAVGAVHGGDGLVGGQVQHHGVELIGDAQLPGLGDVAGGVLGAGQLLPEGVQAKAVVDALVQDAAQFAVPLQDQQVLHPVPARFDGGGQAGGPAADDDKVYVFHRGSPLTVRLC